MRKMVADGLDEDETAVAEMDISYLDGLAIILRNARDASNPNMTGYSAKHAAEIKMIEDAVEAGIEAAAEYVSAEAADKSWDRKEYKIAEIAAREAIAALRQAEAGK